MRVTLLSKALVVGAYQRKAELLAEHPGLHLTVLVPTHWGRQQLERAHTCGYALSPIPICLSGHFHTHFYPSLTAALRRSQPDVLHVDEEPYNLATWLAVRQAERLRPKPKIVCFSWQNLNRRYPPPFSWMERDVLRRIDALIVGSEEAKQVWQAKGFRGLIAVTPQFGVDEALFAPLGQRVPQRPFVVGFAGRLVREKGVDVLLRAVAQLPDDVRLRVVGEGGARASLVRLSQQLGLADRTTFEPPLRSTAMPAFYRSLDALVLPSRTLPNWKEQFGRVLIEAMACGTPVVTSRCGEAPHVVGDAGLVFDEEDAEGLAAHLCALHSDPTLWAVLSQRGRERVLARFTMRCVAAQTLAVWRKVWAG